MTQKSWNHYETINYSVFDELIYLIPSFSWTKYYFVWNLLLFEVWQDDEFQNSVFPMQFQQYLHKQASVHILNSPTLSLDKVLIIFLMFLLAKRSKDVTNVTNGYNYKKSALIVRQDGI